MSETNQQNLQPAPQPVIYQADQTHHVAFTWTDGNFEEARTIDVPPLPDQHAEALIDAAEIVTNYDKRGKRREREDNSKVDNLGIEIFDKLCSEHRDVPEEIKLYVLNQIWLSAEAEKPIFKSRADAFAPPPGQIAIQVTLWNGETTEEWDDDELPKAQPYFYFRKVTADDKRAWLLAVAKPQEKFDKKGRLEQLVVAQNTAALRELLFGSEASKREPLFIGTANYAGTPRFYHLFKALTALFEEDVRMGESSARPRP